MIRHPAVAGQFYSAEKSGLSRMVRELVPTDKGHKVMVQGAICPHAGLVYSGSVAGAVYAKIETPQTFILIGPNHTGIGKKVSIMPDGQWEVPNGMFDIDEELSSRILNNTTLVTEDQSAHLYEHSIEVQLPFLAHYFEDAKIVPITVMMATLEELKHIGKAIAMAVSEVDYPVVVVSSSDMSHYVPDEEAREKDRLAIDRVLDLDPDGLFNVVREEHISMCGFMPSTIMLAAAKELGATEAHLVKYTTSAEVSGDFNNVVGYAGMIVF